MTLNSVAPARTSAPNAIDPRTPGSGADAESSLFHVLLADAHHERTTTGATACQPRDNGPDESEGTQAAATRRHHAVESQTDTDDEHLAAKQQSPADHEALLASLAALAFKAPAAPPATDPATASGSADGVDATSELLSELPPPDLTVADDAAATDPTIPSDLDVTAALSTGDVPAPSAAPSDADLASARAVVPRTPVARPVAADAAADPDDDVKPAGTRTSPNSAHGIGDGNRMQAPPAPVSTTATPVAPPAGPTAVAVDASANEAATAVATTAPPPPAEQLVSVLSPLRTTSNGSYSLRLELKPVELGRVEMRVEMRDGVLHASIHADHEGSAQLVRASLGELRDLLAAEGVRTGNLTVSDGALGWSAPDGRDANQARGDRSPGPSTSAPEPAVATRPIATPPTTDSEATSLLDVRV